MSAVPEAAEQYRASLGWSVLPVGNDKKPLGAWKALQSERLGPKALAARFRDARAVGVAVACGPVSGLTVVDLEHPTLEHTEVLRLLELAPQDAPRARSGGGGVHLFFAHHGERNAPLVSSDGEHLGDIRGEGGYIILAPSAHPSGNRYAWEVEPTDKPPTMPGAFKATLSSLLKPEKATPTKAAVPPRAAHAPTRDSLGAYAQKALEGEIEGVLSAPEGTRNDTLNRAAYALGQLVGAGALPEATVRTELEDAAQRVGLPDGEAVATILSGMEAGKLDPRNLSDVGTKSKNSAYSPFSSLPLTAINPKAGKTAVNGSGKKELEASADWFIDPALISALEWGEVLPLPDLEPELPLLEPELIPLPLRPWICDLSELSGLPPEAFLAPAVSAAGCLIGRRVAVRPKRFDTSWKVTANMWGMLIGRPSSKKSFAVSEATKPLAVLERAAREEFEASQVERELEREMLEAQIKAKKKQLEDALTGSAPRKGQTVPAGNANSFKAQVLELHTALATLEQDAHPRRYLVNSSTVEKLGELLRENPNGLMVLRDEIKGFFGEMDKAGREGEKQFHLEAWNGIGSFTFDRIGRGTVYIPNMCVGVFGGIQPSVIQKYITGALEEGEGSDGFLQRFQLAVHIRRSSIGVDRTPNKDARARVYTLFEKLDALTPEDLGLETQEGEIPALGFVPAAQTLFDRWREVMETRLIGDELKDSPMLESHLGKYGSLIAALALTFHLIDVADGSAAVKGEISLEALTVACELGDFLEAHAQVTYAAETGRVAFGAYALAGLIAGGKIKHGMRLRNLARSGWEGLPVTLEPSLGLLETCQIARVVKVMTPGAKKPTRVIVLNPALDLEQLEDSLKGGEQDG